ncbi:hypothetical protein [Nitrososphaera sp.]|uniref:hypothetical protein n=1 Tax=Nitrososphaera sp. TaxID=1971748 RepID=UPI00307F928E
MSLRKGSRKSRATAATALPLFAAAAALVVFAVLVSPAGPQCCWWLQPAYAYTGETFTLGLLDGLFEYKVDVDASQLFPSTKAKQDVLSRPGEYVVDRIDRSGIMGFSVSASDVKVGVRPSKLDSASTRLDMDIRGRDVVIDSAYLHKKFDRLDIDGVYGVYNSKTDVVTLHIPFSIALSLLLG